MIGELAQRKDPRHTLIVVRFFVERELQKGSLKETDCAYIEVHFQLLKEEWLLEASWLIDEKCAIATLFHQVAFAPLVYRIIRSISVKKVDCFRHNTACVCFVIS